MIDNQYAEEENLMVGILEEFWMPVIDEKDIGAINVLLRDDPSLTWSEWLGCAAMWRAEYKIRKLIDVPISPKGLAMYLLDTNIRRDRKALLAYAEAKHIGVAR